MRILDVGAHDGFIARHLLREFPEAHIDAIELNSRAVAACAARINGRAKVGAAEDAPILFTPGTYDVVFAGELIEHVVDVPRFLDAMEAMAAPDGRVVISTPDGTFGEGGNPHHLRCYRAADLAELLRRRGEIVDMAVGDDGIASVAYMPAPRGPKVAIYCHAGWEAWHPGDIVKRGLGGSETAAVRLAECLSELGLVVTVYGEIHDEGLWRNVIFRHYSTFDPLEPCDGLISSRFPEVADRPLAAKRRLLWLHDTDCGPRLTPARAAAFDAILTLSDWHRRHVCGMYPFAADRVQQIRNGVHLPYFAERHPWKKRVPRLLFTSSPDRGLDVLLRLWPRVRKQLPNAEFAHCYSQVYDSVAATDGAVAKHRDLIRDLAQTPGVVRLGSLGQRDLAQLMCASRVWAHPSWASMYDTPFHETSCIGAMEAQAAGCVVVASGWGALPETVGWGRLVDRDETGERWVDGFVHAIVEGLTNQAVGDAAAIRGPEHAAQLGWAGVAASVAGLLTPAEAIAA